MLVPVLSAAGYDVTAVGAATEALALIKKTAPAMQGEEPAQPET